MKWKKVQGKERVIREVEVSELGKLRNEWAECTLVASRVENKVGDSGRFRGASEVAIEHFYNL